ncbi:MAG: hypothetical protein KDA21_04945, partial [Phycisphaerales bacterium]|nr:hypothetical protein [Phycisphaerales bacterium]
MCDRKLLSLLVLCAWMANPTSGQTIIAPTWTCATGDWSISGCWDVLGGSDTQPDNGGFFLYDVTLPTGGSPYTVSVASGSIDLRVLIIDPDVTLRLDATNFAPGLLDNRGVIEHRNDDLFLDDDIINDGLITFDTASDAETIEVRTPGLTISGSGDLHFPDVPGATTSVHRLIIPDGATTTNGAGHTIRGGPGQIRGGSSTTTDFVNQGTVRASTPGMTLEFIDLVTGNIMQVINSGELSATGGGRLEFDDIAEVINTGVITCDALSEIFFNSTVTSLEGTLDIDGLLNSNTDLMLHDASGSGTGTLSTAGDLTLSGSTTVEFGVVDHNSGALTIENGASLTFSARWTHSLTSESAWDLEPGSQVLATGGTAAAPNQFDDFASLEIAGRDEGDVPAGYISNFNIPHLVIGPGARVNLFDAVNNGNRGGPGGNTEALYVGTLEF